MTKEEAIELIKHIGIAFVPTDQYGDYDDPGPYEEAIDMAIEALSAEAVQGEWTNEDGKPITDKFSVYCSRCKRWSEYRTNYCGHCGARMKGGDDE